MLERLLERETGARQIVLMRGARESGRMRDCGAIKIGIIKGAIVIGRMRDCGAREIVRMRDWC